MALFLLLTATAWAADEQCELPKESKTLLRWQLNLGATHVVKISSVPEAMEILRDIETDISIISMMGPYRTGKSFLLDQLVPHPEGMFPFKVGDTVQPETEEVSMVILPPCVTGSKETLIVLDSPGLFAPNRASVFDSQLLAVLNLLSSVVLYNSQNIIDRSAIEKLSYAVDTAFAMSYFDQKNAENAISRPHLIWLIQNFHLKLESKGKDITGDKWITGMLEQVDQSNNGTSSFKKQFTEFFSSIDVRTLPHPVEKVHDLKRLSTMPASQLDPKYRTAVAELWTHLLILAAPKTIGQHRMTGAALAKLVEKWTENMNVPISSYRSNSADDLLGHIMSEEVSRASIRYARMLPERFRPPLSEAEINGVSEQIIAEIVGSNPAPRFVEALREAVAPLLDGHRKANEDLIREILEGLAGRYFNVTQTIFDEHLRAGRGPSGFDILETGQLGSFESDSSALKTKHPGVQAEVAAKLRAALLVARAVAVGASVKGEANASLVACMEGEEAAAAAGAESSVQRCLASAMDVWRGRVEAALAGNLPPGRTLGEAAGEASVVAQLKPLVDGAAARVEAVARRQAALSLFEGCASLPGAELPACAAQANLRCGDGGDCEDAVRRLLTEAEYSAAVARCEAYAADVANASAGALAAWWRMDRPGGWLGPDELEEKVLSAFHRGPCEENNSSRALDERDQALRDAYATAERRAQFGMLVVAAACEAAVMAALVIIWTRLCCVDRKTMSETLHLAKVSALSLSIVCSAAALIALTGLAVASPHNTARLSRPPLPRPPAVGRPEFPAAAVTAEHFALMAALAVELLLLVTTLNKVRKVTPASDYQLHKA